MGCKSWPLNAKLGLKVTFLQQIAIKFSTTIFKIQTNLHALFSNFPRIIIPSSQTLFIQFFYNFIHYIATERVTNKDKNNANPANVIKGSCHW